MYKRQKYGCEGALFPWESAWITDGEVTPSEGAPDVVTGKPIPIYTGIQEIHVNADIAYAVHRYFEATDDQAFMEECGFEMILETALYWASRAEWNEERIQYDINGVIGPDEYSEHVSNNAYTNYMASWNIHEALRILERLRQTGREDLLAALEQKTGAVTREEWMRERAEKLTLPQPDSRGIIPQDEAFLSLPELDLTPFRKGGKKILEHYNVEPVSYTHLDVYKRQVYNYDRTTGLMMTGIVFLACMVLVGRGKGVKSILSLAFTMFFIIAFLLPMIYRGYSPVLLSILTILVSTAVSMLLLNGYSAKTLTAIASTMTGVDVYKRQGVIRAG